MIGWQCYNVFKKKLILYLNPCSRAHLNLLHTSYQLAYVLNNSFIYIYNFSSAKVLKVRFILIRICNIVLVYKFYIGFTFQKI